MNFVEFGLILVMVGNKNSYFFCKITKVKIIAGVAKWQTRLT